MVTDEFTSYRVREPHYAAAEARITELCAIEGVTYIGVPDGVVLPEQPPQVVLTECILTPELIDDIKAASPHVRLINERVVTRIRSRYSTDDEIGIMRTAPSDEATIYNEWVEGCRAWGREQKAELGL